MEPEGGICDEDELIINLSNFTHICDVHLHGVCCLVITETLRDTDISTLLTQLEMIIVTYNLVISPVEHKL